MAGQAVLLVALVLLPGRSDWATPTWLDAVAGVLVVAGLGIVAVAALRLGTALTPTPVPTNSATLSTDGLYRFVRHPIYTGVLAVVVGVTVRSGSWIHLAIGAVTYLFFDRKAAWEERLLTERYGNYPAYAARTPKFVPRFR